MSNPWFRMYHEFATDPKVQMLSEQDQRRFVMLLCLRCGNGDVTLHDAAVAFQLRIGNDAWAETKARLVGSGLIGEDNKPTNWDKRQFVSDSSKSRVSRHREAKKQPRNGDVTLQKRPQIQIQIQNTDTESKKVEASQPEPEPKPNSVSAKPKPTPRGARLQPDWALPSDWFDWTRINFAQATPDLIRLEAEKFADYWHAKSGQQASKLDWQATWRNWCRTAFAARPATVKNRPEFERQRDPYAITVPANTIRYAKPAPGSEWEPANA